MPAFIDTSPQLPCFTHNTHYHDINLLDWYSPLNLLSFIIKAHPSFLSDTMIPIYLYTMMNPSSSHAVSTSNSFINNTVLLLPAVFVPFLFLRSRIKNFCLYQNHSYKNNKKTKKLKFFLHWKNSKIGKNNFWMFVFLYIKNKITKNVQVTLF